MPVLREMSQRESERDVPLLVVERNDAHLRAGHRESAETSRKREEDAFHKHDLMARPARSRKDKVAIEAWAVSQHGP